MVGPVTTPVRAAARRPPLRVGYLNGNQQVSGAEVNLLQTVEALAGQVEPVLVVPDAGEVLDWSRGTGLAVRPVRFSVSRRPTGPLAAAEAARRLVAGARRVGRVFREERVDVVHANSIRDGVMASLARVWHRRPVVWSVHDFPPPGLLGRVVRELARRVASAVIVNSEAVRRDFGGARAEWMETIYPVLPASAFRAPMGDRGRAEWGIPPSALVMGYVGQITPWKRVRDAILAFRDVAGQCDRAWLIVAGEPKFRTENVQYFEELQTLTRESRIADRVRFVGFQREVDRVFRSLDVLVHPAEREPFGRVVAEAMACGVPVVATSTGGIPEIVEDGRTGYLFPVGGVAELSGLVLRLFGDEGLRARLGAAGRVSARRFAVERAVAQTVEVYLRVLRGRPPRPDRPAPGQA